MKSIKGPLLATAIFGLLGFGMFMTARDIEKGIHQEYSGRRAGSKRMLAALAESLGTTGSLVVWIGGTAAAGAWLVLTIRSNGRASKAERDV